jgi:radical SAM enzyme (TIGR01210 family)
MENKLSEQILKGSEKGHKHYKFDESHDEHLPANMWFQESDEGLILFLVFYTQACRWSQCLGCNLPSQMSAQHVSYKSIISQIDKVFDDDEVKAQRLNIRKVILSNNGSILDEDTFSSMAFMYFLVQLNLHFPNLSLLSIESRIEYVETSELEFIARALAEGDTPTQLEIAIGFEAFDKRIRNRVFRKGLTLSTFQRFVKRMAPYKFHLKCYFMQKPVPGMSDKEAVLDIKNAIDYLAETAVSHNIEINMHLNPTYAATGTVLEDAFLDGSYKPPLLIDTARAACHAKGKPVSIFIGLFDEGLAVEGGSFIRPGEEQLVQELEKFNKTQDYGILEDLINEVNSI